MSTIRTPLAALLIGALILPSLVLAQATEPPPEPPPAEEPAETVEEPEAVEVAPSIEEMATSTPEEPEPVGTTTPEVAATSTPAVPIESSATSTPAATTTPELATTTPAVATSTATSTDTSVPDPETPAIVSGTAVAIANILNLVNTNFVNSKGVVLFSSLFETLNDALDLRDYVTGADCTPTCAVGDSVRIDISSDAQITNDIVVRASSGENELAGDGSIETGDAYAGLNLVNIANTNIIDSSYLLVTLNAFQNVNNDIVFPSLASLFTSLISGAASPSILDVEAAADVANNVQVTADSGGNTSTAGTIATGNSSAVTNVFNSLNSTLAGDRSVSILFRVHGDWVGEVFGAPEGLSWIEDPDGGIYLFDASTGGGSGPTQVESSATALIENNVSVVALTGDNHVEEADAALITTGNAYAGANIVNIANGNVVGRNWVLAVINIFGDFNGNIAFGRPDLWVGEQIDAPANLESGDTVEYKFTVINNGDSPATKTMLVDDYDEANLEVVDSPYAYTQGDGTLSFELASIPAGGATEVTYRARVTAPPGTDITNTVTVTARETDDNLEDNTDTATITTYVSSGGGGSRSNDDDEDDTLGGGGTSAAKLDVMRTTAHSVVSSRHTPVSQEVVIRNDGTKQSVPVILRDVLRGPSGDIIQEEPWDLGPLLPGEEVTVTYDIEFGDAAPEGTYTLTTVVDGPDDDDASYDNGTIELALPVASALSAARSEPDVTGPAAFPVDDVLGTETALASDGLAAAAYDSNVSPSLYLIALALSGLGLWLLMLWHLRRKSEETLEA